MNRLLACWGSRFSLIELMTALAVVAVLAAVAIPAYAGAGLRARHAELPLNMDGILAAALAYREDGVVHAANWHPNPSGLGRAARPWSPAPQAWTVVGFVPDGDVRASYTVRMADIGLTVQGVADMDADGVNYVDNWQWDDDRGLVKDPRCSVFGQTECF